MNDNAYCNYIADNNPQKVDELLGLEMPTELERKEIFAVYLAKSNENVEKSIEIHPDLELIKGYLQSKEPVQTSLTTKVNDLFTGEHSSMAKGALAVLGIIILIKLVA